MAPHSSTLAWKIPWSLVGCSPWGREELGTTEWLYFPFSLSCIGEGNGTPLQCSCLENPRDRGAWWAAVYGVAQSRTRWKRLGSSSSSRPTLSHDVVQNMQIQSPQEPDSTRSSCFLPEHFLALVSVSACFIFYFLLLSSCVVSLRYCLGMTISFHTLIADICHSSWLPFCIWEIAPNETCGTSNTEEEDSRSSLSQPLAI